MVGQGEKETVCLTLRRLKDGAPLKAVLKGLLRSYGWRCEGVRQASAEPDLTAALPVEVQGVINGTIRRT